MKKLRKPYRPGFPNGEDLAVTVYGHKNKAVIVIKKFCFVTIGKHLQNILKSMRKIGLHHFFWRAPAASGGAVLNALDAFLRCIQPNIVQANEISGSLCFPAQALGILPRQCGF